MNNKELIESGAAVLGIEFGSTRIKAVLINKKYEPIASGSYTWENTLDNGIWTYPLSQIHEGLQSCYADLKKDGKIRRKTYKVPCRRYFCNDARIPCF